MTNLKVLEHSQVFMTKIGIHSHNLNDPTNEFFNSLATYYVLFNVIAFTIVSSAIFSYVNLYQFELALHTSIIVIAGCQCGGMFLSFGLNMTKVKVFHLNLQKLIDECDADEVAIYWANEQKCRKRLQQASYYIIFNQASFVITLIFSIYCLISGSFDASKLVLPFNLILPFDTTTVTGWYFLWFIEFNIGFSYVLSMVGVTSYFVCCCYYICTICDHFFSLLQSLEADVKWNQIEKVLQIRSENIRRIKEKFLHAIEINIKAFE